MSTDDMSLEKYNFVGAFFPFERDHKEAEYIHTCVSGCPEKLR